MRRAYYSDTISRFRNTGDDEILGKLARSHQFPLEQSQRDAWLEQITVLKATLPKYNGSIYFEYAIPRMGRRIDVAMLIGHVLFVVEFKVGEDEFPRHALDQVWDYALDLKNFHETSADCVIAPILVATKAAARAANPETTVHNDGILRPLCCTSSSLTEALESVLESTKAETIHSDQWESGRYRPTPTIVEAAMALYARHSVDEILKNDATAINLTQTSDAITGIIETSRRSHQKSICFVTGVPGAGKTLVGLNIATKHVDNSSDLYSVFLSGNGPLVAVLREALARNKVQSERENGRKVKIGQAKSEVQMFIQNVHHFRDECLLDPMKPPSNTSCCSTKPSAHGV